MALPQISMAKQDALTPIDELLNKEVIRPSKATRGAQHKSATKTITWTIVCYTTE